MLQPDIQTQQYIKEIIYITVPRSMYKQFNPCLSEIEIPYDFYTDTDAEKYSPYLLHEYFGKHLALKFSRKSTVGNYNIQTYYRGRLGYVWKGCLGVRCYIKNIPGINSSRDFCRLEKQYNRKYLRKLGITVDDMPFNSDYFNNLEVFEFLDDFSAKEIKNMTRSIMRKNGTSGYNDPKCFRFAVKEQILRQQIYGAFFADDYVSVPEQIERCNEIKKRYGLTLNPKKHCKRLFGLEEIVQGICKIA